MYYMYYILRYKNHSSFYTQVSYYIIYDKKVVHRRLTRESHILSRVDLFSDVISSTTYLY